ncbi:MAG: alpha/beta fold hydrolase, partial [Acidimicrobiales bacterium]
ASVSVSAEGETASPGSDFRFDPLTLDFAADETEREVAFSVHGDDDKEPSETFRMKLASGDDRTLGDTIGIGTIVNDDGRALEVAAKTGDSVEVGWSSATFTGFGMEPSVNDDGLVAFIGRHSNGGDGIFVWDDGVVRMINPCCSSSSRNYGDAAQINDDGMVVARDRISGAPPSFRIRVWDANETNDWTVVAEGGSSNPDDFTSVTGPASIGDAGDVAFIGATAFGTYLGTSSPPYDERYTTRLHTGLRPMIDDQGRVVVKVVGGSETGDVLRVYSKTAELQSGIACAATVICAHPGFSAIGRAAGISDDGRLVGFYGVEGNTGEPGRPGVFVSVEDGTGTRTLARITGVSGDGRLDPGETWEDLNGNGSVDAGEDRGRFSRFEPDARVGVNAIGEDGKTATVVFAGYDTAGTKGLFSARIDLVSAEVTQVKPLLKVGDEVDGLPGTVTEFSVFDPLNNAENQDTVLWAKTSANAEAILHRRSSVTPLVVIPGAGGSELFDLGGEQRWPRLTDVGKNLTMKDAVNRSLVPHDVVRAIPPWLPPSATPDALGWLQLYGPLLDALGENGYREYEMTAGGTFKPERRTAAGCDTTQEDATLFVFTYDWRKDIADSAQKLDDFLGCVQQIHPDNQVNVLAHSMGGLVARRYVTDSADDERVNAMITLGSPWLGAPKMLFVLETGSFIPVVVSGDDLKAAVETMPGLHQLLPGLGPSMGLAPAPLIEEGRDFDGNGRDDDRFEGPALANVLDQAHPGFRPGTVGERFHGEGSQDDWAQGDRGVTYYNVFGQEKALTTPEQVSAVSRLRCAFRAIDPADPLRGLLDRCHLGERLSVGFTWGDGTVPIDSTKQSGGFDHPVPGDLQGHNAMLRNPSLHNQVLEWLQAEGGPKPPDGIWPFLAGPTDRTAVAETSLESATAPVASHWITIDGGDAVVVSDDKGNSTAPIDGTQVRGTVPGVEQLRVGAATETIAVPAGDPIRTTFRSTGEPIVVEALTSDGDGAVVAAVRYLDVEVPSGVSALLDSTPSGLAQLRYDGDGDGTFETAVPPTASVTGAAAQDTSAPDITLTETVEDGTSRVAVAATDGGTGLKAVYASVNGSRFEPYTSELLVNPGEHPVVWAAAADNAGNRSFASLRLTPPPADDAPVARDRAVETVEDTPAEVAFDAESPDELPLTFTVVAEPAHGTLSGTGAIRTYTPAADFNGSDQFTYRANDGTRDSNVATVTITTKPVNDAPVAAADAYSTASDTALAVPAPGVLANDRDVDGDALRAELVGPASHGTASVLPDGSVTYAADAGFSGSDQFTYRVGDGTAVSDLATVTITVTPSTAPPDCSAVRPSVTSLWPANHKLQPVTLTAARDGHGGPIRVKVTAVQQDEPVNGPGDGDQSPDAELLSVPDEVRLRAERSGTGDGRVYRLSFTATDAVGDSCTGMATVGVPHQQNLTPAIDSSPPAFDSLKP